MIISVVKETSIKNSQITAPVIIRAAKVRQKTGLAISSIYALMAQGKFPASVQLSLKSVGWVDSEIDEWIAERINNRNAKQGGAK